MSTRKTLQSVFMAFMLLGSMSAPLAASAQAAGPVHQKGRTDIGLARYADLVIASTQIRTIYGPRGTAFKVLTLTVKNAGFAPANPFTIRVTQRHMNLADQMQSWQAGPLAPGESAVADIRLLDNYHPGTYLVELDVNNAIYEGPSLRFGPNRHLGGEWNNSTSGSF